MEWFLSKIDISDNVIKALRGIAKIPPGPASTMFAWVWCFPIMIFSGCFAWYFDLSSTWSFSDGVARLVAQSLPGMGTLGGVIGAIIFILTIAPTIMEMGGAFFARQQIWFFQILVWAFVCFDLYTDGPRITQFLAQYEQALSQVPWVGGPLLYWVVWLFFLLLGSYGFELVFVVAAVSFAACLFRSGRGRRSTRAESV